jgi:transposase
VVDALGNPIRFHLTPGQASDLEGADVLLEDLAADILLGDKGYDADERVIERLEVQGKTAVIPPRRNVPVHEHMTRICIRLGISLRTFLPNSSNIERLPPAMTSEPETFWGRFI